MTSSSPSAKRLTFTATPEVQTLLDQAKKELFYNCTQSQMIRALTAAGLRAWQQGKIDPPPKQSADPP